MPRPSAWRPRRWRRARVIRHAAAPRYAGTSGIWDSRARSGGACATGPSTPFSGWRRAISPCHDQPVPGVPGGLGPPSGLPEALQGPTRRAAIPAGVGAARGEVRRDGWRRSGPAREVIRNDRAEMSKNEHFCPCGLKSRGVRWFKMIAGRKSLRTIRAGTPQRLARRRGAFQEVPRGPDQSSSRAADGPVLPAPAGA
jgi:hypothetical protein